jgi:hypothetical protein
VGFCPRLALSSRLRPAKPVRPSQFRDTSGGRKRTRSTDRWEPWPDS